MIRRLIIDGYSLLHRDPSLDSVRTRDMRMARELLIRKIDRLADALAPAVELVFDGRQASREQVQTGRLQLVYAPSDKTADTVIEQLVHADPVPSEICVVTADQLERVTVTAAEAQAMSCVAFLEWMDRLDKDIVRQRKKCAPARRFTLGDFFPES
ncbi:MAG TPA: NYN domain-containing protein [Kiritimatiellia bacterium]|nr:NYN domain-containing protein [Kiritimatiellia bacterium]